MFFERIGRDHYQISSDLKYFRIVVLQRSSHAGGSVRVISVTILGGENQSIIPLGQLMQRKSATRHFGEKARGFCSDSWSSLCGVHVVAPQFLSNLIWSVLLMPRMNSRCYDRRLRTAW